MSPELEQLGVAWFEEPLLCEDIPGHPKLAAALNIPTAMGETLGSRFEFDAYLRTHAVDILQPDIAGKEIANPIGQIFSGALMVHQLGYPEAARTMEKAVEVAVADRNIRTRDLGGEASTQQMGKAITERVATL